MTVVNVDVRNRITEAIINLKTVKHTKPNGRKVFSYLRKSDEELGLVVLQSYLENLWKINIYKRKGAIATKLLPLQKNVTPPNVKKPPPRTLKQNRR